MASASPQIWHRCCWTSGSSARRTDRWQGPDMETVREALATAIQHHREGRLQSAEQIYRWILHVEPDQAEAIQLLGVIAFQERRLEESVALYRRSLVLKPDYAEAHNNLGVALTALGSLDEAAACCRR